MENGELKMTILRPPASDLQPPNPLAISGVSFPPVGSRGRGRLFSGYKPQFFFRTTNVTGEVRLGDGIDMVMPGDNASLTIALDKPVALEPGSRFAIREGGKTIGSSVVTGLID
jgi:translation elongation factor EF-Tu-like GTPase